MTYVGSMALRFAYMLHHVELRCCCGFKPEYHSSLLSLSFPALLHMFLLLKCQKYYKLNVYSNVWEHQNNVLADINQTQLID